MTAGVLLAELRQRGIALVANDGQVKYTASKGSLTQGLIIEMKVQKVGLLAILEAEAELCQLVERLDGLDGDERLVLLEGPGLEALDRYLACGGALLEAEEAPVAIPSPATEAA
jgi:hypothetical protein